jgi:hypothetical protein
VGTLSVTDGLSGVGAAPTFDNQPGIRELNVPGRALAVASAHNTAAEHLFIKISRSVHVGDGYEMCNGEPFAQGHFITLPDLFATKPIRSGPFASISAAD